MAVVSEKIPVGVLGATGTVGQRFVERLANHPWFVVSALAASERSAGRPYGEAARWRLPSRLPAEIASMKVRSVGEVLPCRAVFSALDAVIARDVEPFFARSGVFVFSNASAHRMDEDVPLLIPEINPDSLRLLDRQRRERGWSGALVSTMQAVSGAGYPGVASLDILGNVMPDIPGEAEKIEREVAKILGGAGDGLGEPAALVVSAMTNRVPVEDGHTESISVGLSRRASAEEMEAAWQGFRGNEEVAALPSAPERPVLYLREAGRPQPRRDVDAGNGMCTVVGGLKACPLLDWKFTVLGHNTVRGAAGASILNAELAVARGLLK